MIANNSLFKMQAHFEITDIKFLVFLSLENPFRGCLKQFKMSRKLEQVVKLHI